MYKNIDLLIIYKSIFWFMWFVVNIGKIELYKLCIYIYINNIIFVFLNKFWIYGV